MSRERVRRPSVVLFDIDGTLMEAHGLGRQAINNAFERVYNRVDACNHFRFDGMTDYAIARQGLEAIGVEPNEVKMKELLGVYLECLAHELSSATPDLCRTLPGVEDAVQGAHAREMAVGLGTGNLKEGARLKLSRVGLWHHFTFGGFGCDNERRPELILSGARRGAEQLGVSLEECRVVVIGDTPHDVAAAKFIGAECIGVGTGAYAPEALRQAGAHHAFSDLSQPEALEVLFGL